MIAQRDDVHTIVEEFLEDLGGQSAAASGIFGIADHQIDMPGIDEIRELLGENFSAGLADHVSDA